MTTIQRIDAELAKLHSEYSASVRGKAVMPPKARTLMGKIEELKRRRQDLVSKTCHTLGSQLPEDEAKRNEVFRLIVKLPIIADFLYSATVDLRGTLSRHGINELTLSKAVRQIHDLSRDLAFTLSGFPQLEEILSHDDMLVDSLHKRVDSFLKQRMNITQHQ